MPTKKDYYEILGVPRGADEKTIKAAYRKLARRYHPDVNQGDKRAEERFKEVSEAFAVLSDPAKRAQYDRGGHAAFGPDFNPFAGTGFDVRAGGFGFPDLQQVFEMFGLGGVPRSRGRARRGNDLQVALHVSLEDAAHGTTLSMQLPRRAACDTCGGSGGRGGCPHCGGSGLRQVVERLKVRVPPGIEDGGRLRLAGKGDAAPRGGRPGDAYLEIRIKPHPRLRRDGRDLSCDVAVGLARAALGGEIVVPTLDGETTVSLPPGTRSGQRLRIRGKGVPSANGSRPGDLYAVIQIHPPRKLDRRSRELLQEFAERNPRP